MDLESLKYADLRQLAKSVGLKANMKAEKLLKTLKKHFEQQQENSENGNTVASSSGDAQSPAQGGNEVKPSNVTRRRGKGQYAKRKHSDQKCPALEENPAQDNATLDEAEGGESSLKRRKVASTKAPETPEPKENQKEAKPESITNNVASEPTDNGLGKKAAGRIPRHEGLLKKKASLRPTTPNFKKLHEAHFSKMESIDSYVQRKNKQMESLRDTVKELQVRSENTVKKPCDARTLPKPSVSRGTPFSPGVQERNPAAGKRRFTPVQSKKSVMKDSAPFRPTVLSAKKVNVRFSQGTQDNEHKHSLVKTPARLSPVITLTPTPGRKSAVSNKPETNKNTASVNKTPGSTPFVFSGSSTTPSTNKKNTFDLKASLSRPLSYKPHKGKLKPFGGTQENTSLNKSQTIPSHQKNYKQHQVQTREERRIKHADDRKQKKEKMLGARRGLVMT